MRKSLGHLVGHKCLKLSEALNHGVQIADGLAKAHAVATRSPAEGGKSLFSVD